MEFTVKIEDGEVYINGEYIAQLCFDPISVGWAISNWLTQKETNNE